MLRQASIDAPGVLHHIICGGIEQRDIFHDDADRKNSVDRLGDVLIMRTNKANASFRT
jgi:putative transposase